MPEPKWTYFKSETLSQKCAYDSVSGWLFVRDGTKYSPDELELLGRSGKPVPLLVHLVKSLFDGIVVDAPKKYC